jgi:hypothetical protein
VAWVLARFLCGSGGLTMGFRFAGCLNTTFQKQSRNQHNSTKLRKASTPDDHTPTNSLSKRRSECGLEVSRSKQGMSWERILDSAATSCLIRVPIPVYAGIRMMSNRKSGPIAQGRESLWPRRGRGISPQARTRLFPVWATCGGRGSLREDDSRPFAIRVTVITAWPDKQPWKQNLN